MHSIATKLYPDHMWHHWKFQGRVTNWWKSAENRTSYLQWLGTVLNFKSLDDYYALTVEDLVANYGDAIVRSSRNNVYSLLKSTFPEHKWHGFLFKHCPQGYWSTIDSHREYMEWLRTKYHLHTMESLGTLTNQVLLDNHGAKV